MISFLCGVCDNSYRTVIIFPYIKASLFKHLYKTASFPPKIQSIGTGRCEQTVQTQIRLLLWSSLICVCTVCEEQIHQGLHCLPFHLDGCTHYCIVKSSLYYEVSYDYCPKF